MADRSAGSIKVKEEQQQFAFAVEIGIAEDEESQKSCLFVLLAFKGNKEEFFVLWKAVQEHLESGARILFDCIGCD